MTTEGLLQALRDGAELHEGLHLEFKEAAGGLPHSLWESYSALANTDGGTVVLGVGEGKNHDPFVAGVDDADALVRDFWNGLSNPQKVSANLLLDSDVTVGELDGKRVVFIRVPRADRSLRPVYINGNPVRGSFKRSGDGDRHCTAEEVRAMERDSGDGPIDKLALPEFGMDVFCEDSIRSYRTVFDSVRLNHPWSGLQDEEFLLRLGALGRSAEDGGMHPTRAGLLMFGHAWRITDEYPNYFLDCRQVASERRWDNRITSSSGDWSGNVYDFSRLAYPLLIEGLPVPFELDGSMRRVDDTPQHKAVREALVNALVHTDYYGRTGIVCVRTADALEVSNPGSLRLPAAVIEAGGVSDPRNLTMLTMFSLIGMGERAGSGFDMFRKAAEYAKTAAPEFEESFEPARVELRLHLGMRGLGFAQDPADSGQASADSQPGSADSQPGSADTDAVSADSQPGSADTGAVSADTGSNREQRILSYVKERGPASTPEIAELLGLGISRTREILALMVASGELEAVGAARATRYRLSSGR